jgi:FtsP/CotA-like multicopper oxidase with cupredoxin domain
VQGANYTEPWTIRSSNGKLSLTLIAQTGFMDFTGIMVKANSWNNSYTAPLLRLNRGDTLELTLKNNLTVNQSVNIHFHGLHVTPTADNALRIVAPGTSWTYVVKIPADHPVGTFWYHSHAHLNSEMQVHNGMSGSIIIEGILPLYYPSLKDIREVVIQLKDLQYFNATPNFIPLNIDSNAVTARTVNGVRNPTIFIQPNEVQIWHVFNIGADIFYQFNVSGTTFYEIQRDARPTPMVTPLTGIEMGPGTRVSLLVVGPPQGEYTVQTDYIDNYRPFGDVYPATQLATLVSSGTTLSEVSIPSSGGPNVTDLRNSVNKPKRLLHFNQTHTIPILYYVNNKLFDPTRVDITIEVGDIETWLIWNDSSENHWFHIHQTDFQVTVINGVAQPFVGYQDTVIMPRNTVVEVVIPFTNPAIVGKFMFHCHILEHEDTGMMGVVEVVPKGSDDQSNGNRVVFHVFLLGFVSVIFLIL